MQVAVTTDTSTDATQVQTGSVVVTPDRNSVAATKLIVAVHGVGDQHSYATLQSVVNQFCRFYKRPLGIPLGAFHNGRAVFSVPCSDRTSGLESLAFAEVYWAGIPRKIVDDKHTLEEAKKWATTIVERLRLRWHAAHQPGVCQDSDFSLSTRILHEMIQTIAVADRLCFLAEKAGLFTFDLRKVLDDYLGDVQVVAEFADQRKLILEQFLCTLKTASAACPEADIYIIAHSEGTVVSLLGLMEALRTSPAPAWTSKIRGFMTLGSPIDKHLYFWPDLFEGAQPSAKPATPIAWRNYYDHGDPIGFELDGARDWLASQKPNKDGVTWRDVFEFTPEDDLGFTRYPFPGKAHVDYWDDGDVFAHFITSVMDTPSADGGDPEQARSEATDSQPATSSRAAIKRLPPAPANVVTSWITSWIAPYVGVFALLVVAAFLMYKAVLTINNDELDALPIFLGSMALAMLLAGITVAARIPRLTRSWNTRLGALGTAAAAMVGGLFLWGAFGWPVAWSLPVQPVTVVEATAVIIVLVCIVGASLPQWGAAPMIVLGTLGVLVCVVLALDEGQRGSAWPMFPAAAAFLYLWWLAALLFDLVVVWHLYIRSSLINLRIREMTTKTERVSQSAGQTVSAKQEMRPA